LWRKLLFVVSTTTIRTGLFRLEAEIICVRLILALSLCPSISISPSLFTRQREMKGKRMSKEYSLSLWIKSNESQNIINTVSWFFIITYSLSKIKKRIRDTIIGFALFNLLFWQYKYINLYKNLIFLITFTASSVI